MLTDAARVDRDRCRTVGNSRQAHESPSVSLVRCSCRVGAVPDQGGAAARRHWRPLRGLCVGMPARHGRARRWKAAQINTAHSQVR
jgi:hypothetical protein